MGSLPEPTTVSQHRDLETRIIGGKVADSTRFPYYTYVRITSTEGDTSCGGSLIAPDVVMTAAHCIVPEYDYDTVNAVDVWVNSTDLAYTKYQYYRAATRWVAHPAFELERVMNDIGLIFLDAPVKGVPFVKINRNASIPDSTNSSVLTAIGLGAIEAPAQYPKFLMQVGIN
jgi:secreted trypsin-like serine protease